MPSSEQIKQGEQGSTKVVFFQNINSDTIASALRYLRNGFTIYYYSINPKIKQSNIALEALNKKTLRAMFESIHNYSDFLSSRVKAYSDLPSFQDKELSKSFMIKMVTSLISSSEVELDFKKKLRDIVLKDYEAAYLASQIAKLLTNEKVEFYVSEDFHGFALASSQLKLVRQSSWFLRSKNIILNIIYLFYPFYLFSKKFGGFKVSQGKKTFQVAISIDQPDGIFLRKFYGENTLLDKDELPPEVVLFIDETSKTNLQKYESFGLNCISYFSSRHKVSLSSFFGLFTEFLPVWFVSFIFAPLESPFVVRITAKSMANYICWSILLDNYKIKNYVRRMVPDSASKIELLKSAGIKTWIYYPDATSVDNLNGWDETYPVDPDFTFMDYDFAVLYGARQERFFRSHKNKIGHYIQNGVLYSQLADEIRLGKHSSRIDEHLSKKPLYKSKTKIGIFDTTFALHAPMTKDDGVAFASHMLKLLNERKDLFMIFKIKYPWDELQPELQSIYSEIRTHERALLYPTEDGDKGSSAEVISHVDFTISAAYTSTAIESICAGKKAVYHDPNGKYSGDDYYFNQIPKFVSHNYSDLVKLIEYWLDNVTDDAFNTFVQKYIKVDFDPYLDKKALTRFRKMLMQN